jgi:hypothetical protein
MPKERQVKLPFSLKSRINISTEGIEFLTQKLNQAKADLTKEKKQSQQECSTPT